MRRRDRGDGRRPVLGIAHRADGQDVVLQQLEHDPELETGRDVPEDRPRNGPRDERAGDHHLRQADEIQTDQRAPHHEDDQDFGRKVHVNSPTGMALAVGTSCAVTSMPRAASWRSLAASSSVK